MVIDDHDPEVKSEYHDTAIDGFAEHSNAPFSGAYSSGHRRVAGKPVDRKNPSGGKQWTQASDKLHSMMNLYDYGDGSFAQKCLNFHVQGKFMEDYEDDYHWSGHIRCYYPTYHDLRYDQLRGYFSWRTGLRRGECDPGAPKAYAYIYIYELLNGIGAQSPEESIAQLERFEDEYFVSGYGSLPLRAEILFSMRRWMRDLAIVKGLPREKVLEFMSEQTEAEDNARAVLRNPGAYDDRAVYDALCVFAGDRYTDSVLIKKTGDEGLRLFAGVWRHTITSCSEHGIDFFRRMFGGLKTERWYPMSGAVWYDQDSSADRVYELNECHRFICSAGKWTEECYQDKYFNQKPFMAFMHETDRSLRVYLGIGARLKEIEDEAWVKPFVNAVIEEDKQAKIEAKRPKIVIDLDGLDQIRMDADVTRDRLLTDEEKGHEDSDQIIPMGMDHTSITVDMEWNDPDIEDQIVSENDSALYISEGVDKTETKDNTDQTLIQNNIDQIPVHDNTEQISKQDEDGPVTSIIPAEYMDIIMELIAGHSVKEMIKAKFGMPEIYADSINEALYDEIGDNVVECVDGDLILIEDYIDDLAGLMGLNEN